MKKILFIAFLSVIVISCNKDQAAIKKLSGNWESTKVSLTQNGVTVDMTSYIQMTYLFEGCILENDEYCSASSKITSFGEVSNEENIYRVKENGTELEFKSSNTSSNSKTIKIIELTKTNLILQEVNDSSIIKIEAIKI